ncbi:ATP-binding cassette domain-containing protein [Salinicoccus roseus]|uniref:ATP-binding cassette domain-containing protein n=1 Tax=Salinicoccus roseus TaxID=45670 RepID=UPI001CA71C11|nr:ATP-binding cassette domain-containing protein [Salinicoccus roseus]MBY8910048.1 ATP-binding cassette domain-containing protein [Salinicoccus roseus]
MEFLRNERKQILYSIILGLSGGLVGIALFGLSGYMISLSFFDPPFFVIILIIAVIKLFGMMKGAFKYIERLLSHEATFQLIGRLRLDYFRSTIRTDRNTHSVKFIQRLNQYFEQVENYYIRIIYPYIVAVLISLLLIVLSIYFGPAFAVLAGAIAFILLFAIPKMFEGRMAKALEARETTDDALYGKLYHFIHDYTDLWVTKKAESQRAGLSPELRAIRRNEDRLAAYEAMMQFIAQAVQIAAIVLIIVLTYEDTPLWVPMVMLIALSYFDLIMPVMNPASQYGRVKSAVAELETDVFPSKQRDIGAELTAIRAEGLNFRYPNASLDVLKDISVTFKKGEKHAIIGSSGSGKTTLIERLIHADPAVTVYSGDSETDYGALAGNASIMPQQLDFYNATVMDNVTLFGHIDRSPEEVAADLEGMGMAYYRPDTPIEFTGRLSGGEQKRLHFIRMLAEDKPWWIMDEPTARLDDSLKQKVWDRILSKPTLIISTHDLNRLESFDFIHYMEQGRIIESGSYEALMKEKGAVHQAVQRFRDYL